jgi:hypothetical protein
VGERLRPCGSEHEPHDTFAIDMRT